LALAGLVYHRIPHMSQTIYIEPTVELIADTANALYSSVCGV
jgi:hypothetical protein